MSSKNRDKAGRFTVDFHDINITVGGMTQMSGYFFTNAMNEYWVPYDGDDSADFEIAYRLQIMKLNLRAVREQLMLGVLIPHDAAKLYDEIAYIIKTIARVKPFCYMDLDAERERCEQLFSASRVQSICDYLHKRATFTLNGASSMFPRQQDIDEQRRGQKLMDEFLATMRFYDELGQGMANAHEIGKAFVAALERPIRRTESNLLTMAQECIEQYKPRGFVEFESLMRIQTEYVPIGKSKSLELGRRVTFERFGDFLLADFFEGLHAGHYPLRCGVCKQYFLQTSAHRRKYCDGYAPNDPKGRSCEAFAARTNRLEKERAPDHPVKEVYITRRGTINKHLQRGKITSAQAKAANRHIERLLDRAIADNEYFLSGYTDDMKMEVVYAAVGVTL